MGLACALFVAAVAVQAALSAGDVWFFSDDLKNLRWAIELRDAPWLALLERHAMHDHVRPLTLMAVWLGAVVSGGAFWGPQLVLVTLVFAGLAGVVALGRRVGGGWLAGLVAGALFGLTPSFQTMTYWNAWMCTAGEVACGTWALVAAKGALDRGRPPWAALGLVVGAGLFKEPGWLVYPAGILAMLAAGRAPRRGLHAAAVLLVAALGFAFVWHPANAGRYDASLARRLVDALEGLPGQLLELWGASAWRDPPSGRLMGPGLPAAVVFFTLLRAALPGVPLAASLAGGLAAAALAAAQPFAAGALFFGLPLAALARRWRAPPVGLVLAGVTCAIMGTAPTFLPAHLLAAAVGLSVFVGAELADLSRVAGGRLAWGLCVAAIGVDVARWVPFARDGLRLPMWSTMRDSRDLVLGGGAVARTLGVGVLRARGDGLSLDAVEALLAMPLVGLTVEYTDEDVGTVRLSDAFGFDVAAPVVDEALMTPSLLRDRRAEVETGATLPVEPGWYALGLRRLTTRRGASALLTASDACGRSWTVTPSASAAATITPVLVEDGCSPLVVRLASPTSALRPFLAPLRPPETGLWAVATVPRVFDLGARHAWAP